jgi:hypothetical protein
MSPVDDTLDGIVLRWPKPVARPKAEPIRQHLDWLALPIVIVRLCAELLGWLAILGFLSQF